MTGRKTCRVTQMGKRSDQTGCWRDGTAQSSWLASNSHLWCFARSAWVTELSEFFSHREKRLGSSSPKQVFIFRACTGNYVVVKAVASLQTGRWGAASRGCQRHKKMSCKDPEGAEMCPRLEARRPPPVSQHFRLDSFVMCVCIIATVENPSKQRQLPMI